MPGAVDIARCLTARTLRAALLGALLASASTVLAAGSQAGGDDVPDAGDLVWCHDAQRAIVTRTARWRCEHRVVDAEEAARVKQQRVERIKRVLQREREPLLPGKRLIGSGTGFFISGAGHLLTNAHVVSQCAALSVSPAGGEEMIAQLLDSDTRRDLALLATEHGSPDPATFRDVDEVIAGEPVTLVGYPLHGKVVIKPVMVTGTVREPDEALHPAIFSVDVDVRRGNSGGPILDASGRVIGVVFAKVDTPKVYASTGRIVRDVGIGLRLPVVREFLRMKPAAMTVSDVDTRLESAQMLRRAREFIAQVRCWK